LQVDVYRKIWKNFLEVIKLISEDIHDHELKASELKGILSQSDDLKEENEVIKKEIKSSKKEENRLQKDLTTITKEYNDLKNLKDQIEKLINAYEKLELKRDNLNQECNQIDEDFKEAEKARDICINTKDSYIKYGNLIPEEARLQKINQSLQEYKAEKIDLEHQLTIIKSSNKGIAQQIKSIEDSQKDFKTLKKDFQKSKDFQIDIEKLQKKITNIGSQEELLNVKKDNKKEK